MSKPVMSAALYEKAQACLYPNGAPTSKSGMARAELRMLERRGVVKKAYVKLKSGTIECFWRLT